MNILRLTWLLIVSLGVFVAGSGSHAQRARTSTTKPASRPAVSRSAVMNRAPLQQGALALLPLGAIKPRGWVRTQLRIQADGLGGHLDDFGPTSVRRAHGSAATAKAGSAGHIFSTASVAERRAQR